MVTDIRATDRLPSLPQVLLRILDAMQTDQADFHQLAAILHQDAAMMSRLLSVANSGFYNRGQACQSVERALLVLGTDSVRTIVITASIKQYFNHFSQQHRAFLRHFWRRSLISANLAQVIAHLTRYSQPNEAYLCGLLMDVGRLQLLTLYGTAYRELSEAADGDTELLAAEQQRYRISHCDLGAELIDGWQLSSFISDAVRYHHESVDQVQDAHHLVKIINLASLLSAPQARDDYTLEAADRLFGLTEALTRELRQRVGDDVERLASSLGIDIDTDEAELRLGQRLGDLTQLNQVSGALLHGGETGAQLQHAVQRAVYMTLGVEHCLLFLRSASDRLSSSLMEDQPAFELPLIAGRSLVTDAVMESRLTRSDQRASLAVIDRQLQSLCRGDVLVCLPLTEGGQTLGALVLGMSRQQLDILEQREALIHALGREVGAALHRDQLRGSGSDTDPDTQLRIREAVHEAGNPLSIIRNYLEMLRLKLGVEHDAHQDLQLIKQEIDRVGHILLRLQEPEDSNPDEVCDANTLLRQTCRIFERSILSARGIELELQLDAQPVRVQLRGSHFKQIITNLLKNAAEVLSEGGVIRVETDAEVSLNGQNYAQINIIDNGPGIPDAIRRGLFKPTVSTKGGSHGGLGLSIVKRLMDENGGTIVCKSSKAGTQFQLLLPTSP